MGLRAAAGAAEKRVQGSGFGQIRRQSPSSLGLRSRVVRMRAGSKVDGSKVDGLRAAAVDAAEDQGAGVPRS